MQITSPLTFSNMNLNLKISLSIFIETYPLNSFLALFYPETHPTSLEMSFLGFGSQPQISSEQKIAAAEAELDMITTMFNQLLDSCYRKCFDKNITDENLSQNESLCIDRCVTKYFEANVKVSESMQSVGNSGALARK